MNVASSPKKVLEAATSLRSQASAVKDGRTAAGAPDVGKEVSLSGPVVTGSSRLGGFLQAIHSFHRSLALVLRLSR